MIVKACWPGSRVLEENPAWKLMRSSLRERDMTLAPEAVTWLTSLPWTMHPQELCMRYPRIANRMALVWPDVHLTGLYFGALLNDKRGGRRGFSTRITEELMALRSYYAELHGMASGYETNVRAVLDELVRFRRLEAAVEAIA